MSDRQYLPHGRRVPVSATAGFPRLRQRATAPWRSVLVALVLIAGATAIAIGVDTSNGAPGAGASGRGGAAVSDARAFLRDYVLPSGRIVRRDQGDTTVSEGQAYGLLLAEVAGEPRTFARIWDWTRDHLQGPDGELASATNATGTVTDPTPASDADVLTAWALSRTMGQGASAYHAQARRMSAAILGNETVRRGNRLTLAAGPWATGSPASLNPSYWEPTAFADLARFTGDQRWLSLNTSARALTDTVTHGGALLPPDWARLDGDAISATPAPNHQAPTVQYGLDAQRLVVWLAVSCTSADRSLAAGWWKLLSGPSRSGALALNQSGGVIDAQTNALPYVAAAAAAGATGDYSARTRLLGQARDTQSKYPTYYGGAWLALSEALLTTSRLGGCTTQGGS